MAAASRELPAADAISVPSPPAQATDITCSRWIQYWPAYLRVAGTTTALFALVVVTISLVIGTPLNPPDERISVVLGINIGIPLGLAMLSYLATQAVLIVLGRGERSGRRILGDLTNDMFLLALFVAANYLHFNLKMWIPLINPALYDAAYMATDEQLRPIVDAFTWISTTIRSNFIPEFRWYQFIFFTMFVLTFCRFSAVRNAYYPRFAVSMLLMVSLGALSYLIAPALGPFIYEDGNTLVATEAQAGMYTAYQQIQVEGVAWIERHGSDYFTGALAAMPSLHVGYASLMTYYMLKNRDYLAPLFVFFWLWILFDSVALRWHYVIDAPAGLAFCAVVIWLTNRLLPHGEEEAATGDSGPALARPGLSTPKV